MKNIYFISDAHLGCLALEHRRNQERRLVSFLDAIEDNAEAVYLMGDMIDFWFEYTDVVPKGYTRFFGKLSELTDRGVEVHYFTGNHDMWMDNYLKEECGVIIHREPYVCELRGHLFYMAHGDGQGETDQKTLMLFRLFRSRGARRLARMIHPHWFIPIGQKWARHSRQKHEDGHEPGFKGEDKEKLILFAKDYLKAHPQINYFIFGHRHIQVDCKIGDECRVMILGDWIKLFTYAVFDGDSIFMGNYVEGETKF